MDNFYRSIFVFYWTFIRQQKWKFLALLLMPLIWGSAETYAPYLIKIFIDRDIILNPNLTSLSLIGGTYIFLMASIECSLRFSNYLCIQIIPVVKEKIRTKTLEVLDTYSYRFFQSHQAGNLLTNVKNLVDSFEQIFLSFFYGIYPITITFLVSLVLIGNINGLCAWFFSIWYIGMNAVTLIFLKSTFCAADIYGKSESKLLGFINDLFRNILAVKTFPKSITERHRLLILQKETVQKEKEVEKISFKADSLRGLISFLFLSLIFVFLMIGLQRNLITIGDFVFMTATCFYVRRSTWMATVQLLNFLKYFGIARQSFSILVENYKPEPLKIISSIKKLPKSISFNKINFSYEEGMPLYQDFNLNISARQKIGITGVSGVGKTTLIHLLLRLINPQSGTIFLGKYPINDIDLEFLKKNISYVPQIAPLFHRSIYENISYGCPEVSYEKVIEAAKACLCHQFILQLQSGYDTIIGEDGIKLSGGQRQRLSLVRAFLMNAPILILDEATSALDSLTENKIMDVFLKTNKTILFVSHRFSVLEKLDRIVVLKDGKIIKEGPSKEILASMNRLY